MGAVAIHDAKARVVTAHYIGGKTVAGEGGEPIGVHNPFDNREICRIAPVSTAQVNEAVECGPEGLQAPGLEKAHGTRARAAAQ